MTFFTPNLFIPGVAKCGTTTLHELLNQHPDICMSTRKEPHFWTDLNFNNFTQHDIDVYKSLFNEKENSEYYGESSTGNLFFPEMFIPRLKKHNSKNTKFIIILRNPIDRCYSHYWWCKGTGREKRPLIQAVEDDMNSVFSYYYDWPNYYYQFGLYSKWILPFIEEFTKNNIKIITLEKLNANTLETLNDCFLFLNLEPITKIHKTRANKTVILKHPRLYNISRKMARGNYEFTKIGKYLLPQKTINQMRYYLDQYLFNQLSTDSTYPEISTSQRIKLKELYSPEIYNLERLLGRSLDEWTDFYCD